MADRLAKGDPLALILRAQAAQLSGDRNEAREAFHAMTARADTRLFGLRGLFIEAQRGDDPLGAVAVAEEALKIAPSSAWASQAVLGFRCAQNDWAGAMKILDGNRSSGLIASAEWQRQRAVLLTAQALEFESPDRDKSREAAMEAVRLAPALIPAAVLAAKFLSESGQIRKAMRIIESAWRAQPHPDLADAYSHVRLSDSARERLARAEQLAARTPSEIEGALAVARAAIDAAEYTRARSALAPFIAAPTQRVAMLMAEIERAETGDDGRAREWTLRAVRAALDPAWTADGYVSDRWRPVSPVTGRLDAFQWMVPVAALPAPVEAAVERPVLPPPEAVAAAPVAPALAEALPPPASQIDAQPVSQTLPPRPPKHAEAPPAVFRPRSDLSKMPPAPPIPPVVPIAHPPDDPGIDDDLDAGLSAEGPGRAQQAGWRGFLSRMSR
jgi:HemY protein